MGGDHSCYTCGRLSEHSETCPRRAWGVAVVPGQESHLWRPTEEQEAARIARNLGGRGWTSPKALIGFDASAVPAVTPEHVREYALRVTREWLEQIALAGRVVQAEEVLLFAEAYAGERPAPADRSAAPVRWECPNGCENAKPAWWPAPLGGTAPPCSRCDAPLKRVTANGTDAVDAALKVLAEHVELPFPGRRLVDDAGSPERVRADARNRAMMERVLAAADAAREEEVRPSTPEEVRERLRAAFVDRAPEVDPDGPLVGPMLDSFAKAFGDLYAEAATAAGVAERRDRGAGPDLVARMIDARECLRAAAGGPRTLDAAQRGIAGAVRWLDEGIEEGMQQRELYARLWQLVAGEPHVCTCVSYDGESESCSDAEPHGRCRFESALRSLLGLAD